MKCVERVGKGRNAHIPSAVLLCERERERDKKIHISNERSNISVAEVNFISLTSYFGKGMGEDFHDIKHYFSRIHLISMLQVLFITILLLYR